MSKPFIALLLISPLIVFSQKDTIKIINGSFEDKPQISASSILNWYDCGRINFPLESPPDIHPGKYFDKDRKEFREYWDNNLPASDKSTYLGMVVRDNGTYESVSQRLDGVLEAGECYSFTIHIARAPKYVSMSHVTKELTNYTTPAVFRIWGGLGFCNERELLAESSAVSNDSWQIFKFEIKPKSTVRSITFQAFYKTPVLLPYNGNILIDGASHILKVPCAGEIAVNKSNLPPHKRKKNPTPSSSSSSTKKSSQDTPVIVSANTNAKPKIMTELNRATIKQGQIIEIKKLEFAADTSSISKASYEVLEELYVFMAANKDIIIEIGGHTNNVPSESYCDKLSTSRAKAVAEYLVNRGVSSEKIQFKGYGKRKPIADNKTVIGRQKNQRVEIKILSV